MGCPGDSVVKNPPVKTMLIGSVLGLGRSPKETNVTQSNILAWEIPWTGEPGSLLSMGSQKSQPQLSN